MEPSHGYELELGKCEAGRGVVVRKRSGRQDEENEWIITGGGKTETFHT